MSQGKIVLMACGSFSPPTFMHLRLFEIAKDYINSLGIGTVVGGIISPVHDAYGKKDLVAAHHRIAMLKCALRSSSWIKVSEWETQQSGWTRTRISMQYHQDAINEQINSGYTDSDPPSWIPDDILNLNNVDEQDNIMGQLNGNKDGGVTVKLLCGADLMESFATPGLWSDEDLETIVGKHGLVVVTRAGNDPGRFIYESDMLYKHRHNIILLTNYIANEVSSTVIRRLVRRGESAKYLTEDSVLSYIRQHRLYSPLIHAEYSLHDFIAYGKRSPQDITMKSPEETTYKNILINIRDKPTITDETVVIKRAKKTNFLLPTHTDSISPMADGIKPKIAYIDKVSPSYVPGKAVKIISDGTKHTIQDDKVSFSESTYSSLDSYLKKDDLDYELYRRRVSEGNMEQKKDEPIKKRCSSSIRKLCPEDMKKSKSEVSKLCDKIKSIKLKEKESRNYRTRSCNDIVRLILTKHGIHVISDTEAIV